MNQSQIPQISYQDFCKDFRQRMEPHGKPVQGQWELTYHCNLNCIHCCVVKDETRQELTFSEITGIMDKMHEEGCLWLCFTGGEPLMRDDFLDIYTYAGEKGFLITIFTNGTLITGEIADYLSRFPPFSMEITLNGITQETYEKVTRVHGSFNLVMEGIKSIMEKGIPLVLKSNGMTVNYREILEIKKYTESLIGKGKYRFDPVIMPKINGSKEPCSLRLTPEEIVEIERSDEDMAEQCRGWFKPENSFDDSEYLYDCTGGRSSFNINPYGRLQICNMVQAPGFDLRKGTFRDGFHNFFPKVRSAKYRTNPECKGCEIRYLCRQCPGRALLENGDMEEPVEYFCKIAHRRFEMKENIR